MKFLRRDAKRYAKFGKGKGKKAKWRNPTGRHNKIREGIKGHPTDVKIGYKRKKSGKKPVVVMNLKDLEKVKGKEKAILGKIGKKKKIEIVKKAQELKIELININPKSFLRKNMKKNKDESKVNTEETKK